MPTRRKRFTSRSRTTRRPKGDWVYRGHALAADGTPDEIGSYANSISVGPGVANSNILSLYDSKQHLSLMTKFNMAGGGAGTPTFSLPTAARAEGSRPLILRVQGVVQVTPSAWAIGNGIRLGYRIMAVEQDAGSGSALLDNDYSMWSNLNATQPADHANARRLNLYEKRFMEVFNASESASWLMRFNVKLRVRLNPNEMLGLYIEHHTTSVTASHYAFMRTFVVDEGTG